MKKALLFLLTLSILLNGCMFRKKDKKAEKTVEKIAEKTVVQEEIKEEKDWTHVASPEWEDQIIYFILTDRFNDGDPSNNDQGANEYDPSKNSHYSGGDIKGITEKIDYIKDLGVTAVWITPPVANQWWDPWVHYSGYHGYWAENFKEVDKHYGTLEDYKDLSKKLHKNDMYLIQDVVLNHTGDFIRNRKDKDGKMVFEINEKSSPLSKPSLYPFNLNDYSNENEKEMGIYNFTPQGDGGSDQYRETFELSGLDDLNTKNPLVKRALKDAYSYWIKEVGVDGFRVDTAIYVDHDFLNDFFHSEKEGELGVENYAKTFGKEDFYSFGETWVNTENYSSSGEEFAKTYIGTEEKPEIQTVINFPLLHSIKAVIGEGVETAELGYRLKNMMTMYDNPYKLANFIDNHDMNRFLNSAPYIAYKQALMLIMTIPGVPVIYQGTEQQFTVTRGAMFKEGFASGGKDNFNRENDAYRYIKSLAKLRTENRVLRRGKLEIMKESKTAPGAFAYRRVLGDEQYIILMNTADEPVLLDELDLEVEEGTKLDLVMGLLRTDSDKIVGKHGKLSFIMQPRAGLIYKLTDEVVKTDADRKYIAMDRFENEIKSKNFTVSGESESERVYIVIDKMIKSRIKTYAVDGKWTATIPVENLNDGIHDITAYIKDGENYSLSDTYEFQVKNERVELGEFRDEVGDDNGPNGKYIYPNHESFNREMDIKSVEFYSRGKNLEIVIEPANKISTYWKPKFGFDHVSYSIYIDTDGGSGTGILPYQRAKIKDDMMWNYMILAGGWSSFIYSSNGANEKSFGNPIAYAPQIKTDYKSNKISIVVPSKAIGEPEDLKKLKVYITTWDYDGLESSYRKIKEKPEHYIFGGGDENSPLIMDDTEIMDLRY